MPCGTGRPPWSAAAERTGDASMAGPSVHALQCATLRHLRRPSVRCQPGGVIRLEPAARAGDIQPSGVHVRRTAVPNEDDVVTHK